MTDYFTRPDDVLENKFGITDPDRLMKAEAEICYLRQIEIEAQPIPLILNFTYFLSLHKRLFDDLYEFAGQIRTVDLVKDDSVFCYTQNIDSEQRRIFSELEKEEYLSGLSKENFAERIAYYASELNALHPFREGNGRTVKLFLGLLARRNNYLIQYQKCKEKDSLKADIQAFHGNLQPLIALYKEIIECI